MEMFDMLWPSLAAVLGAILTFGWLKLKATAAKTETKIDDKLIRLVEEVVASSRAANANPPVNPPADLMTSPTKERPDA